MLVMVVGWKVGCACGDSVSVEWDLDFVFGGGEGLEVGMACGNEFVEVIDLLL